MSWNPNTDYWQLDPGWRQQGPSTTRVGTGSRSDAMVGMFSHLIWRHAAFAVARHHCGWRNTQCRQFVGISVHLQRVSAGLLRARRRDRELHEPTFVTLWLIVGLIGWLIRLIGWLLRWLVHWLWLSDSMTDRLVWLPGSYWSGSDCLKAPDWIVKVVDW